VYVLDEAYVRISVFPCGAHHVVEGNRIVSIRIDVSVIRMFWEVGIERLGEFHFTLVTSHLSQLVHALLEILEIHVFGCTDTLQHGVDVTQFHVRITRGSFCRVFGFETIFPFFAHVFRTSTEPLLIIPHDLSFT
jgi:hypothetical protein